MATTTDQAYSAAALRAWIKDLVDRGMAPREAMRHVHAEIARDPEEAARWWEALGIAAVKKAYAVPTMRPPRGDDPAPAPALPHPPRLSWRQRPGVSPLDIVVPVGQRAKRIGDFTRNDVETIWRRYQALGLHMVEHAKRWKRIGEALEADETIQGALVRMDRNEIKELAQHLGADSARLGEAG